MRRIDHATMGIDYNGAGKNGFRTLVTGSQLPGTVVTETWLNDVQEEIQNVLTAAGLSPTTSRTQLADAIGILASGSGSANAVSIRGTSVLASPAPANGDVLQHNGSSYLPGKVANASIATAAAIAVTKLATAPSYGDVLTNVSGVNAWAKFSLFDNTLPGGSTINDYNPAGLETARVLAFGFSSAGAITLTGINHPGGLGSQADFKLVLNANAYNLVIKHNDAGSSSSNRVTCPGSVDLTIPPGNFVVLFGIALGSQWYAYKAMP
jgi:hypothetical protein